MKRFHTLAIPLAGLAAPALAQGVATIDRDQYAEHLRGMWLGECIANWTGLRSEGKVTEPPFLTDEDWGRDLGAGPLTLVLDQDPWLADDDTDVEYLAVQKLDELGATELTGLQLADAWTAHMDDHFLWVSNRRALDLMRRGVIPPCTGMPHANEFWHQIDAQLTTEVFGALAPGMPAEALRMADIPIANTAHGHSAHAAQTFMLFYCLAPIADEHLPGRQKLMWVYEEARRYIPDTSKAADIMDFVLADYLANPDKDDWERTRDAVCNRYATDAAANGFRYRGWIESSVNFGAGLTAVLYGSGEFERTVQIGALSGWDSDNATATMGGLLGLMLGYDGLVDQIRQNHPDFTPSDRYDIDRTRDHMRDHLPDDPDAQDTLTMLAERMIPIIERGLIAAGGQIEDEGATWRLPALPTTDRLSLIPRHDLYLRSANRRVRAEGGEVTASCSLGDDPMLDEHAGRIDRIADGFELDDSGRDVLDDRPRAGFSTRGVRLRPGETVELRVSYSRPVEVGSVLFLKGDHTDAGGWLETVSIELLIDGEWASPPAGFTSAPDPDPPAPFQWLEWTLSQPVSASSVRVTGPAGGASPFVTCAELDLLAPAPDRTPAPGRR